MTGSVIHPSAVVDPAARLGANVTVGPFCVVGPDVALGDGVVLKSHVAIDGHTEIGEGTEIYPFASIGSAPQDLKYAGEASRLVIGKHNRIREQVTINPGTSGGGMLTRIGDHCLFMVGSHIAHDCTVGDHVILANNATLAGHVTVGDHAILGGLSAVHQFVRIGAHAMIGGMSGVENDVIPYGLVMGERASLSGLNLVGLDRRGFERSEINQLRQAFKQLFSGEGVFSDRLGQIEQDYTASQLVMDIVGFIRAESSRAICQPKQGSRH